MPVKNKNRLIVIQDTNIIQSYSGFWGNLFKKFYLILLLARLKFLLLFFKKENTALLVPEIFFFKNSEDLKADYYSREIAKIDIGKYRSKSLAVFNKILTSNQNLKFEQSNLLKIWQNQITIRLSYYYFPYLEVIAKLIEGQKPKEIWILGNSKEEKIAWFLAKKKKIKVKKFFFLDLSWLDNWLRKRLFSRQLNKKQNDLLSAKSTKLKKEDLKDSFILSADFFRHLKTLVPIYKELKKRNKKAFFIFDVQKTAKILKSIYKINKDCTFLSSWQSSNKIRTRKIVNDGQTSQIIDCLGNYFQPLFDKGLALAHLYLQSAENLLDNSDVKGLVFLNDLRPMERALMLAGRSKGIKTLIAHSGMFLSPDKTNTYEADYFSALGQNIKNQLLEIGYPKDKIIVNGDPQLDFLTKKKFDKKKILKKLKLNSGKKIILLVSDKPNPMLSKDEKKIQFQTVSKAMESINECQLVIKPHPAEDRQSLMQDLKEWKISNFILTDNKKIELYDLLSLSSVVIIAWSMVGFEAMLFKVPVIVANFSDKDYDQKIPYVKGGGAVKAGDSKQLKDYLKEFINKKSSLRKKQIKKGLYFCSYYYRLPLGQASSRVVDLICKKV